MKLLKFTGGAKSKFVAVAFAFGLLTLPSFTSAAVKAPPVPENIYQWVQASPRAGYFFNKQQICYGVDKDGYVDKNILIVPTLRVFDSVQIEDVIAKRRWKGESLKGYDSLVGMAEYLRFDLKTGEVTVEREEDLDNTWTTLSIAKPNETSKISGLPERNFDRRFYEAILAYEKAHSAEILAHTKGILRQRDQRTEARQHEGTSASNAHTQRNGNGNRNNNGRGNSLNDRGQRYSFPRY